MTTFEEAVQALGVPEAHEIGLRAIAGLVLRLRARLGPRQWRRWLLALEAWLHGGTLAFNLGVALGDLLGVVIE